VSVSDTSRGTPLPKRHLTRPLIPIVSERVRLTRFVLPSFFVMSVGLWTLAPAEVMRHLTPIVGALALLCAGLNLGRVSWRVYRFSHHHHERLGGRANDRLRRLRRSTFGMIGVLLGTAAMAAGFYYISATVLGDTARAEESRLLWGLTVGGLVLSIVFGELVTHLVEVVDDAILALERSD